MTNETAPSAPPSPAQQRYNTVAIWLHWIIALALAFQLALGFAMPRDASGFALYQFHKSVGIAILVLTVARLIWRFTHRPPAALEGGFTGFLAKAVHVGLYAFMLLAPLTGWALVSTDPLNIPTVLFGAIPWPHLPLPASMNDAMDSAHGLLAWLGIALFVLHVAGALRHQIMLKDGLLSRIAPGGSAGAAFALLAAVVAAFFGTGIYIASSYLTPAQEGQAAAEEQTAAAEPLPIATPTDEATPEAEETEAATEEEAAEAGPPPAWTIQPGGRLAFTVSSGSDSYNGSFSDWDGAIAFDPDNPESADIRMTIRLTSASVGDATMDGMLQGADFFASGANPSATWRSTSVRKTGANSYTANGTLSLKGASKPQSVTFTLSGSGLRRKVEGSARIDRTAFGVGTGDSASALAPDVALSFSFDAVGRAQ